MLDTKPSKKAVHFGAGNIGRGFIGLMLSRSGYEVVFVARNDRQIALLKKNKEYTVTLAGEAEEREVVRNVTAIHIASEDAVRSSIEEADVVTTAVGESSLSHIAPAIARALAYRLQGGSKRPLRIIACENAVKGSTKLKKHVYAHLDEETRKLADECVAFPNAIVDRIVPAQAADDPLSVHVEPFYEWVVERGSFDGDDAEPIRGVRYVDSLEPYAERKLYTVNAGHASAAYFGYLAGLRTIPDVMRDARLREKVEGVMRETGRLLVHKYNWSEAEHRAYIRKAIQRFSNPRISDKVARVGRSPLRKLGANDRLVRPALQAAALGMESPHLVSVISAALLFDCDQDPEAMQLQERIRDRGVRDVIRNHMGIREIHPLHYRIAEQYERLKGRASAIAR